MRSSFAALLTSTVTGPSCSPVAAIALCSGLDVAHVAVLVEPAGPLGERAPRLVLDVDEADLHALGRELRDELGAEPGRAAAHERDLAAQARVRRELGHRSASASRSTCSGSGSQGKKISSSQPAAAYASTFSRTVSASVAARATIPSVYSLSP